jgi:alkylated DNA repair dioxygenase AlkB
MAMFPGSKRPDQLTLNYYIPGGGIAPHSDRHSSFLSPLVVISLGSQIVMDFRIRDGPEDKYIIKSVLIPRRSIFVMDGGYEHFIRPRKMDLIDGLAIRREERYSLTFRNIRSPDDPCGCAFKNLCD